MWSPSKSVIEQAIAYNRTRFVARGLREVREALKLPATGGVDSGFVERVAGFQELCFGPGPDVDGKLGPKSEASLNIQHPRAAAAAQAAVAIFRAGYTLFDSWGNDARDNDGDDVVDGPSERAADGSHFHGFYPSFRVVAKTYTKLGWHGQNQITVNTTKTVPGPFRYRVCADIVSEAYTAAGLKMKIRNHQVLINFFKKHGHVFHKRGFPGWFLPGDVLATHGPDGGHAGIVIERKLRSQGWPRVVELPGPSTWLAWARYRPEQTSDLWMDTWTKSKEENVDVHYLGRLLLSQQA